MKFQITPGGFRTVVAGCMTGEVGERFIEIPDGSCLQLADRVAKRCMALCEEREEAMSDDIYGEAVMDLAPHFALPAA